MPGGQQLRVVLADDTADVRLLLRLSMEADGRFVIVGEAGDGGEVIDVVDAQRPDVVLIDLAMPVMDGLEALPRVRQLVPDACIVVLSGFTPGKMAEHALSRGADAYVSKGTGPVEIVRRVHSAFEARYALT